MLFMGNSLMNPMLFQGNLKKKPYFEGWYYKQVSTDQKSAISFIPGISLNEKDPHSFIQYIFTHENSEGALQMESGYIRFKVEDFKWSDKPFAVQIGNNLFTKNFVSVHLQDETHKIEGMLHLGEFTPIERNAWMPNIMGPFAYIPHMECYHGVNSMSHELNGTLEINDETIEFTRGKGYIEKDWGTNFPRDYVWLQSNHFTNPETSIFFSNAHIPFYGKEFQGYICNLLLEGKQYRFATYTNTPMEMEILDGNRVVALMENDKVRLTLDAQPTDQQELIAPVPEGMEKIIKEGISGKLKLTFLDKKTGYQYEDIGQMAGIEIVE